MVLIGVPSNHLNHPSQKHGTNFVDYTQQNYSAALRAVGAMPLVFPMGQPDEAEAYVNAVDAVLLIGGQDVGSLFYGEEPTPKMGETDRQRDLFELAVIRAARQQGKPLMGICRGSQIINVALGGKLIQDINTQYHAPEEATIVKHMQYPVKWYEPTHSLKVTAGSDVARALGERPIVNSFHHQGIKTLGAGLLATAFANDGTVEAFESDDGLITAVQFHPEMMFDHYPEHLALFASFVDRTRYVKNLD